MLAAGNCAVDRLFFKLATFDRNYGLDFARAGDRHNSIFFIITSQHKTGKVKGQGLVNGDVLRHVAVEPYCYPRLRDGLFQRTLFIAPNTAAVLSSSVQQDTDGMLNLFLTD